jgi:hypothetical protein
MTAPLPSGTTAGAWTAYPAVQKLAAHLRFGLLPDDFSIWLCRDEWDLNPQELKTAEVIFEGAKSANNRYAGDIPVMQEIIAELDGSMKADEAEAWRRVQKACRMFNARWKSTPTWNFLHKPMRGLKALLNDIKKHRGIEEEHRDIIKALATSDLSDQKSQRLLRTLLQDAVVC